MATDTDIHFMNRALQLAAMPTVSPHPNPRVGCVLVRDSQIVGEGYHERAGEFHAEIGALRQAGDQARGATAYVTLEPCCHTGKTPPCTEALIAAGVSRVVSAMSDPNPQVAGRGHAQLTAAGIQCDSGLLEAQARVLNRGFIRRMEHGRPWVISKLGMSLDGRTAMASGESKWITSEASRDDVQLLRARASAVLTGIGTVVTDNPRLTVRMPGHDPKRQPLRVVLDSGLKISPSAKVLAPPGKAVVCYHGDHAAHRKTLIENGVTLHALPGTEQGVDLEAVFATLTREYQVNEVLVEAGARLNGALVDAGLVDEFVIYMAPVIMGDQARGLFHLPRLETMAQKLVLQITDMRAVGTDWRISATPK